MQKENRGFLGSRGFAAVLVTAALSVSAATIAMSATGRMPLKGMEGQAKAVSDNNSISLDGVPDFGTAGEAKVLSISGSQEKFDPENKTKIPEQRTLVIPGYYDAELDAETGMSFGNPLENTDRYLKYTIIDTGTEEVLFETGLLPAGMSETWIPGTEIPAGESRQITIAIKGYKDSVAMGENGEDRFTELNGTRQTVTITIIN